MGRDPDAKGISAGALGAPARAFCDFLAAAGQNVWLLLPWHPPNGFGSPYQARSAFAGDSSLVCLRELPDLGLASPDELAASAAPQLLDVALERVDGSPLAAEWQAFQDRAASWLAEWCLWEALHDEQRRRDPSGDPSWSRWSDELRRREEHALQAARERFAQVMRREAFAQWLFERQLRALRDYANARGVELWGDLAIFVGADSADAWTDPEPLGLDREGRPRATLGLPPDGDHPDGQDWGLPVPDWGLQRESGFAWWLRRFARELEFADALRFDHFMGYERLWCRDREGHAAWRSAPGGDLLRHLKTRSGDYPRGFAEDLGPVRAELDELREQVGLATLRVLVHGFDSRTGIARHLPHRWPRHAVAQTSTHDSDTWLGAWHASSGPGRRRRARCLRVASDADDLSVARAALERVWASSADTALAPMADVLALGSEARTNVPGQAYANWSWSLPGGALGSELLSAELADELRARSARTGRLG